MVRQWSSRRHVYILFQLSYFVFIDDLSITILCYIRIVHFSSEHFFLLYFWNYAIYEIKLHFYLNSVIFKIWKIYPSSIFPTRLRTQAPCVPHGTRHGFVRGSVLSRITRPTDLDFIPERSGILWIRDMENFLHILCIRDLSADFGRLFNLVRGLKFLWIYQNLFSIYALSYSFVK